VRTCNGNADGVIATSTASREQFRMWQHLANAGMLEGRYAGIAGNEGGLAVNWYAPGINVPTSKMGPMVFPWVMANSTVMSGNAYYFDGLVLGNALFFLTSDPNGAASVNNMFRPEEAWNIDKKLDDGQPATGRVGVQWPVNSTTGAPCTTAATSADVTAGYALTESSITCTIYFSRIF